jgi:hypothetical protein
MGPKSSGIMNIFLLVLSTNILKYLSMTMQHIDRYQGNSIGKLAWETKNRMA